MTVEKYENDKGQIGVIVSGGYGAGWSTWERTNIITSEFLCMDKTLVEMALRKAPVSEINYRVKDIKIMGDCVK